ncbi:MAG: hypothetical protein HKN80_07595 [Acidimicrobiia bacterium]|nr:hypothetical protein [Acidimicrobiia bacterium]
MYTTTSRFGLILAALAVGAVINFAIGGSGAAATTADPTCATTCIDAGGTFGDTIPVSLDATGAEQFANILQGQSNHAGPITMDFLSVAEGSEVVILGSDSTVATVRLGSGHVGFVPATWVLGA